MGKKGNPDLRRDSVIQVTDEGRRRILVSPQAKVIHLEPVRKRRKRETIVFLESSKKQRRRSLRQLVSIIGPKAKAVLSEDALIRNQSRNEALPTSCRKSRMPRISRCNFSRKQRSAGESLA